MTETCPHCGQPMPATAPDPIAERVESMRVWCGVEGYHVTWDGHVSVTVASLLLGKSEGTLANWASYRQGPPFRKAGGKGPRLYSLDGIARFLAAAEK